MARTRTRGPKPVASFFFSQQGLKQALHRGHLHSFAMQIIAVAVVLLLSALMLLSVNVTKLQESFNWVQRSDNILMQLSQVELRLAGNESAVRGYALTDDPVFVTYQDNEVRQLWGAIDKLASEVRDEPDNQARYLRLREVVKKRLYILAYLMGIGPHNTQEVADAIRAPAYLTVISAEHAQLDEFRANELKVLNQRQAAAAGQAKQTYEFAISIVVVSFVFAALGIAFAMFGRARAAAP